MNVRLPSGLVDTLRRIYERVYRLLGRARLTHVLRAYMALAFYFYLSIAGIFLLFGLLHWGFIDTKLFVTLWVAEVPIAVFLRYILSEGRAYMPKLGFIEGEDTCKRGSALHHRLAVINRGQGGAESCEGRLTLDIKSENIVDLSNAIITTQSFRPIEDDKLCWATGDAEVSIKAERREFLEVLRVMEPVDDLPWRLEIPSEKGWGHPLVGIKFKEYTGSVRIFSMNSRSASLEFDILCDEKDRTVRIDF